MRAFRKWLVVDDPERVVLSNLPFRPGERVEAILVGEEEEDSSMANQLFAATQQLPQARAITEEEIAEEIAAYRAGR